MGLFSRFIKFPGLTSCDSFIVCFSIFAVIEAELIAYSSWLFFLEDKECSVPLLPPSSSSPGAALADFPDLRAGSGWLHQPLMTFDDFLVFVLTLPMPA